MKRLSVLFIVLLVAFVSEAQRAKSSDVVFADTFRVMCYNVENLFDCEHDSLKNDYEFLPNAPKRWTYSKYKDKLIKISRVIVSVGGDQLPDLVGLCEVENERTMRDLTRYSPLKEAGYRYIITDSPDERGIDVALLYQPERFKVLGRQDINIPSESIGRRPTRDILHVTGRVLTTDTLDVFVCHLPSRAGGQRKSEAYRLFVADILKHAVDSVMTERENGKVLIVGDFNDYPYNKSLTSVLGATAPKKDEAINPSSLYNLMDGRKGGTYRYRGEWGILDQIIVSGSLLQPENSLHTSYDLARIVSFPFLLEEDKKYGGFVPYRTYWGAKYTGGYSDHLPVAVDILMKAGE